MSWINFLLFYKFHTNLSRMFKADYLPMNLQRGETFNIWSAMSLKVLDSEV